MDNCGPYSTVTVPQWTQVLMNSLLQLPPSYPFFVVLRKINAVEMPLEKYLKIEVLLRFLRNVLKCIPSTLQIVLKYRCT